MVASRVWLRTAAVVLILVVGWLAWASGNAENLAEAEASQSKAISENRATLEKKPKPKPKYDNCRKKCVYLTFDDGPWPNTPAILATLKKHRVKATFFVLGRNIRAFPREARALRASQQKIGVHTWAHSNLSLMGQRAVKADLMRTKREIRRYFKVSTGCGRPPYGATNGRVQAAFRQAGMKQIMWDVDPQDWRGKRAGGIAHEVLTAVRPGAVILLHDGGGDRRPTAAALERIIKNLKKRGYGFQWIKSC